MMDLVKLTIPAVCVLIGWFLNEISSARRSQREWRRRLRELRIDTYAEWTAGMEALLVRYGSQAGVGDAAYDLRLSEKRLEIIEHDPVARQMIVQVSKSLPDMDSDDYAELRRTAQSPEWDWPPFRSAMDDLLDHLRRRLET